LFFINILGYSTHILYLDGNFSSTAYNGTNWNEKINMRLWLFSKFSNLDNDKLFEQKESNDFKKKLKSKVTKKKWNYLSKGKVLCGMMHGRKQKNMFHEILKKMLSFFALYCFSEVYSSISLQSFSKISRSLNFPCALKRTFTLSILAFCLKRNLATSLWFL